jgi:hypothetical protein
MARGSRQLAGWVGVAACAATTATMLVGCGSGGLSTPNTSRPTGAAEPSSSGSATTPGRLLPDERGKGLSYAVGVIQSAGFAHFSTHDASGRARAQVLYQNWKVCFQTPASGRHPTTTRVDLGVVPLAESCPAADRGLITATAGSVMPDLRGRSVRYADDVLGERASVSFKHLNGSTAYVLIDSNWEVCKQTPAPGRPYAGVPVTLVVAKYASGGCPKG